MKTRVRLLLAFAAVVGAALLGRGYLPVLGAASAPGAPASTAPAVSAAPTANPPLQAVAALGRLQPRYGMIELAGPSDLSVAISSLLDQAVEAFTFKLSCLLGCERASLFLVDRDRDEFWLKVAEQEGGRPVEVRMPIGAGIAGHVATIGEGVRVEDAYRDSRFNPDVDRQTGFRTRSVLCLPIRDGGGRVFAVAQLLDRRDGKPFDEADQRRFGEFTGPIGVILESWWRMQQERARA